MKYSKGAIFAFSCGLVYYAIKFQVLFEIPKSIFLAYSSTIERAIEGGYVDTAFMGLM